MGIIPCPFRRYSHADIYLFTNLELRRDSIINTKDHVNNAFPVVLLYEARLDVDFSRLKDATSIVSIYFPIPSTTSLVGNTGHNTIRYHISTLKQRSSSTVREAPVSFLSLQSLVFLSSAMAMPCVLPVLGCPSV